MIQIKSSKIWFILFLSIQIILIIGHISKEALWVKLTYARQAYEQQLHNLKEEKKNLSHELYALENRGDIKKYAQESLGMKPLRIASIKRIPARA